jgi:hypothetical protein
VVLTGFSLSGSLLSIAVTPYFPERFEVPLIQVTWKSLLDGAAFPNLITDVTGLRAIAVMAGFSLFVMASVILATTRLSADRLRRYLTIPALPLAMAAYVGFQLAIAPPTTTLQESTRSILLESMGYPEQARRIQEELQNLAPRRSE